MSKPRSIFEDVGEKAAPAAAPARAPRADRRGIAVWLVLLFALIVAMIGVGGLTRLTDSGLSITEWRPVTGALPPADWQAEFDKYRATPQFEALNRDMTLAEFKTIFWWEWAHRQLARAIGAVWALGFLWFALRRRLPTGWVPRLLALGLLGGLQGAIGWWMVRSGLAAGMTSVASYRLAIHLGLAFLILGLIAWYVLRLGRPEAELLQARRQRNPGLMAWGTALVALVFAQVVLGALVAGIDAGRHYPEWPLMAGAFVPPGAFDLEPAWRNFLENPGLVQFNHRLLGYAVLLAGLAAWLRSRASALGDIRRAFAAMAAMMVAQVALGIVTVLQGAPWPIAIVHQLGAVALFALVIRARFAALYPRPERIARA
jgi:cytochrome c oxidase assembly protein subunit 15